MHGAHVHQEWTITQRTPQGSQHFPCPLVSYIHHPCTLSPGDGLFAFRGNHPQAGTENCPKNQSSPVLSFIRAPSLGAQFSVTNSKVISTPDSVKQDVCTCPFCTAKSTPVGTADLLYRGTPVPLWSPRQYAEAKGYTFKSCISLRTLSCP